MRKGLFVTGVVALISCGTPEHRVTKQEAQEALNRGVQIPAPVLRMMYSSDLRKLNRRTRYCKLPKWHMIWGNRILLYISHDGIKRKSTCD